MSTDREFMALYNTDKRGRCDGENCPFKNECVLTPGIKRVDQPFIPFVEADVYVDGRIYLVCKSYVEA